MFMNFPYNCTVVNIVFAQADYAECHLNTVTAYLIFFLRLNTIAFCIIYRGRNVLYL